MYILLKGAFLFLSIIVIMPLVFFILVGGLGGLFATRMHKTSWTSKEKVKWTK